MHYWIQKFAVVLAVLAAGTPAAAQSTCGRLIDTAPPSGTGTIQHVDLVLRADGRPFITYTSGNPNNALLSVIDCADTRCSTGARTDLVSGPISRPPGIILRPNGLPALLVGTTGGVLFVSCSNASCTQFITRDIVPPASGVVQALSMTQSADGLPRILYPAGFISPDVNDLFLYRCNDTSCSGGLTSKVIDQASSESTEYRHLRSAVGPDGALAFAMERLFFSSQSPGLEFGRCPNAYCPSGGLLQTLAPQSLLTQFARTDLVVPADGRPLVLDGRSDGRALYRCADAACQAFSSTAFGFLPNGELGGLALDSRGLPVFALLEVRGIALYRCSDMSCTDRTVKALSLPTTSYGHYNLATGPKDQLALAYVDSGGNQLRLVSCDESFLLSDGFEGAE